MTIKSLYTEYRKYTSSFNYIKKALMLSDDKEAILILDKCRMLDKYAEMRNTDADVIRDTVLADIGLDENGSKDYCLGDQKVTVTLQKDLTFKVILESGKIVKSIPKKDADEKAYSAAKTDFAQIKKDVKKIVNNRQQQMMKDWLSDKAWEVSQWESAYVKNPVLRAVVKLVVWCQDKTTFVIKDRSFINSDGSVYEVKKDKDIHLAHPMEMDGNDLEAWRKYFINNELKQPFEQIWEPVYDPDAIKPDRYENSLIPFYRFKDQEKHGIYTEIDKEEYSYAEIEFNDCKAEFFDTDYERFEFKATHRCIIEKFSVLKHTRASNHIVAYLDRITVYNKIENDDVTVRDILPFFTYAQISDFFKVANEKNAVNVKALLIDYIDKTVDGFDPMAEFVL